MRTKVVWLGDLPPDPKEFHQRDLSMVAVPDTPAVIAECRSGARSVLVPFSPALRDSLAPLYYPVLDAGACLDVVLPNAVTQRDDRAAASSVLSTLKKAGGESLVRTLNGWALHEVAQACACHDPGRDFNPALEIDIPGNEVQPDDSQERLLRRAFSDFSRIIITPLAGSHRPGAQVWRVDGVAPDSRLYEPFVVKVGERREITVEIRTVMDYVLDRAPFPHWAPLRVERSVAGATQRLLVSMFVDRAVLLDGFLKESSPVAAITALFDGPLRTWRKNLRRERVQLAGVLEDQGVLPRTLANLNSIFARAQGKGRPLRQPEALIASLKDRPQLDVLMCHAHGDLHPGNIFIRNNGLDVVLIDFASARYERPACCDPAMLDVALGVGVVDRLPSLPEKRIRRLFERPLLPPQRFLGGLMRSDNRVRAICQLRKQAREDGATDIEYTMAVSIYLMRFASLRPDGANASIAYEVADGLVQTVAA